RKPLNRLNRMNDWIHMNQANAASCPSGRAGWTPPRLVRAPPRQIGSGPRRLAPHGSLHFAGALAEIGLDEGLQVAVEHALRIAEFDAGAQILDARVIEHIVANLVAPGDLALGAVQAGHFRVALGLFHLLKLGHENADGLPLVLRLAAFIHAIGIETCRDVPYHRSARSLV